MQKNNESGLTQRLCKDGEEVRFRSLPSKDVPFSPFAFFVSFALRCTSETQSALFHFIFAFCFPSYPSFGDTMLLLNLCFQPSRKNYSTKQLLSKGSVPVQLFLFLNLSVEQVLFFSIHSH